MYNPLDKLLLYFARSALKQRRAEFYFDVASAMADKVPLFSVLKQYEARARRRNRGDGLMYREMLNALQVGALSDALKPIVSTTELILLDAIQRGGDSELANGLMFLSETVEKLDRMTMLARKAVIYPLVLFLVFTSMLVGFSLYAVPIIEALLPPDRWPPMGKLVYAVSKFIVNYGMQTAITAFVMLILFLYSLPRWQSPLRRRLDKFIPYSVYRVYLGSMLVVSLSVLLKSGVSLRSALERAMKFSNAWLRWHIREILKGLSDKNAARFGAAFKTGLLSWDLEDRIEDASQRRDPVAAFVKIGVGSIEKIFKSVEAASGKINTFMLVFGGLVLGSMMLGFLLTTMEIQSGMTSTQNSMGNVR
jgi:type II secretory pathway component PulF